VRYVQGTLNLGKLLYPSHVIGLISYLDADCGGCPYTKRSTFAYCIFLEDYLISWSSKQQSILSRSSAEADYRKVANVVFVSCWICNLPMELHYLIHKATPMYYDNVSAKYLSNNPIQHRRTKHI
jgi:hypothetical protein